MTVRFYVGEDREDSLVKIYNKIHSNTDLVPPAVDRLGGQARRDRRRPDRHRDALERSARCASTTSRCAASPRRWRSSCRRSRAPTASRSWAGGRATMRVELDAGRAGGAADLRRWRWPGRSASRNVRRPAGGFDRRIASFMVDAGDFFARRSTSLRRAGGERGRRDGRSSSKTWRRVATARPSATATAGSASARPRGSASRATAELLSRRPHRGGQAEGHQRGAGGASAVRASGWRSWRPPSCPTASTADHARLRRDRQRQGQRAGRRRWPSPSLIVIGLIGLRRWAGARRWWWRWRSRSPSRLTLLVNYCAGYTINRVTLFALILSLGLVVDDPIVDVENIYRHLRMRAEPPLAGRAHGRERGAAADPAGDAGGDRLLPAACSSSPA